MTPVWCHYGVVELDRYVAELRSQLGQAVVGDEVAAAVAERLSSSLDAAVRLVLFEVLSDAAGEITRELAPGSVDVRLRGRDPELLVSAPKVAVPESAAVEAADQPWP